MDCAPPTAITITTPTLMHMVSAGCIIDMSRITLMERTVICSFALSKRSPS